jgi:4-methyl-5(b-hydroxyethyl)-thiazole monophosphate biosynthesis
MSKALVFLADGFEEIEAITIIDILRRGSISVVTASISNSKTVKGSHGIEINADCLSSEATKDSELDSFDMIVLPGGLPGSTNLNASAHVSKALKNQLQKSKWISAICAAPQVLCNHEIVKGKKITHYPGAVANLNGATYVEKSVVVDGKITTSRGPGTAILFAIQLVENLKGKSVADTLAGQVLISR